MTPAACCVADRPALAAVTPTTSLAVHRTERDEVTSVNL